MKQIFEVNEKKGFTEAADVFKDIKKINIDYEQENFLLLCLDIGNRVIYKEVVFKGGLASCVVDNKILFRKALLNNANSIIVAHNHPSGNLSPSDKDINCFKWLIEAGKFLHIKVLDSIIFNEKEFYSMMDGKDNLRSSQISSSNPFWS